MPKKFNASQFRSKMQQAQRKIDRAVNDYNRAVRNYNAGVRKFVNDYNAAVRRHNANVRHNRQVIQNQLRKLNSSTSTTRYTVYTASTASMHRYYSSINSIYPEGAEVSPVQERILDAVEQEQACSLTTANVVMSEQPSEEINDGVEITDKLAGISEDLMNRWKGAVFAINPANPDAARHFCTSARELFTEFLEAKAPDEAVFAYKPNAEKTQQGNATRKEKIRYMMRNAEMDDAVADYADEDINNIVELFKVFNGATHGVAGKYEYTKLLQVRARVEQGINFLCALCA